MGRPVSFDFATGGGSTAEFLMGEVTIEPTLIHTVSSRVVLPDAVTLPLVNGKAVHPDMAVSPDGPEPIWAYKITTKSGLTGRAWTDYRGVPAGVEPINYKDLPAFQVAPQPSALAPTVSYLVKEAIADDPTVMEAVDDSLTEVIALRDLVEGSDPRMPQDTNLGGDDPYTHVFASKSGRLGMAIRSDRAEVYAPGGIESPSAGMRVNEGDKHAVIFADAAGRMSELRVGRDGLTPREVLNAWGERMGWSSGGTVKTAGVALTLPDSTTPTTTMNDNNVRLPILLGATAVEWRVHIRNFNDKNNVAFTGALSFTGIHVGRHAHASDGRLSGAFSSTPHQVAGAFTTAVDGSEWTSDWVTDYPLNAQTDYLLSYGYTATSGQSNYNASAGCWTTTDADDVATLAPTVTEAKWAPFDVRIEVKVPSSTPVIMYLGDSLTVGIQSSLPVYDSWAAKHAVANGAIHTVYAIGGSQGTDWVSMSNRRLNKWLSVAKPNAAITALGNNDLYTAAVTLAEMQNRTTNVAQMIRQNFCDPIYLTTVLPRIGAAASPKDTAKAFNDWVLQTPAGARASFDFYSLIANSNGDADTKWSSTASNFHLSTAGYARCAMAVTQKLA